MIRLVRLATSKTSALAVACLLTAFSLANTTPTHAETEQASSLETSYTVIQTRDDRWIVELPNRLVVVAQKLDTSPVVSVQAWVKTGSIYEQEHVGAGLSHFLEHLLAGGSTSTRTEEESNAILASIGGQTNAATSLDTVRYYINTTSEHTSTAVDLISDWMQNNLITQEEFDREREVIFREFAMGRGEPGRIMWKLTQQARYASLPTHPGGHPTIGYLDEYKTITRDEIEAFYKRMYVPNNMVFVVAGDIDPQQVVEQVAELWKDAEPATLPELSFPTEPADADMKITMQAPPIEAAAAVSRPRVRLAYPGTQLGQTHDYELDLLSMVLGDGEASRLTQTLRDEKQLVTSIDAYNLSFSWGEGFFGIDYEVADFPIEGQDDMTPEQVAEKRIAIINDEVMHLINDLRTQPVTDEELQRAKRKSIVRIAQSGQSAQAIASRLASDIIGMHDPDYLQQYETRIMSLTPEALQQSAETILNPHGIIEVRIMPLAEGETPTAMDRPVLPTTLPEFGSIPINLDNTSLIAELKQSVLSQHDIRLMQVEAPSMVTLDTGLRVITQRSSVVPGISVAVFWKGGLLGDEPGQEGLAYASAEMLMRGTENRTATELARTIENLGANIQAASGNNTTYLTASGLSDDAAQIIDLTAEIMLEPAFDSEEWDKLKPRLLAAIDRQQDRWFGELFSHARKAFYQDHPWSQTSLGRSEVIAEATAESLSEYYKQRLSTENTVIAIVGDINPETIHQQIEEAFGSLPQSAEVAFDPPLVTEVKSDILAPTTEKQLVAVWVGFGPGVVRGHADEPALNVLSKVISDFPGGWLERALRGEGDGLAYGVWASVTTGLVNGHISAAFNTQSDVAVQGLGEVMRVMDRAKAGKFTAEDLDRAKTKLLSEQLLSRQTNGQRAMMFALDTLYGMENPLSDDEIEHIRQVTIEDLQRVSKQYLVNPVVVVMSDQPINESEIDSVVNPLPALGD